MLIYLVLALGADDALLILGASVDKTEAEKFIYAYNKAQPSHGLAYIATYTDLKLPSAWSDND